LGRDSAHAAARSEDIACKRRARKKFGLEGIKNGFGRNIAIGIDFVDYHLFFALHLAVRERGVEHDVGNEFHCLGEVATQGCCVNSGIFLGGKRIEFATQILQAAVYLVGLAACGSFEKCVFGQVGSTQLIS
jgi:hypothetical protein